MCVCVCVCVCVYVRVCGGVYDRRKTDEKVFVIKNNLYYYNRVGIKSQILL